MTKNSNIITLLSVLLFVTGCHRRETNYSDGKSKSIDIKHLINTINDNKEEPLHASLTKSSKIIAGTGDIRLILHLTPLLTGDDLLTRYNAHMAIIFLVRVYYGMNINDLYMKIPQRDKYEAWKRKVLWISASDIHDYKKMVEFRKLVEAWVKEETGRKKKV